MRLTIVAFFARRKKLARTPINRGKTSLRQFFFVPTGAQKASQFYFSFASADDLRNSRRKTYVFRGIIARQALLSRG
ncbi:MAG: hypothetical protein KDC42_11030 [Ignavibacteriae bacterium]|nr:hypothetical protein [Ignavibacteriota bacterium]